MKELEKMMISAVLSNADHPEYGAATIPFPIPKEHYDQCMELVKALKIGNPFKKDFFSARTARMRAPIFL